MRVRFLSLVLLVSLGGNAALWLALLKEWSQEEKLPVDAESETGGGGTLRADAGAVDISGLMPEVVNGLGKGDPRIFRDFLDACGAEPTLTQWMVASLVSYRFHDEKIHATLRMHGSGWWKAEPEWWEVPEREEITDREKAEVAAWVGTYPRK
jgi:hypothetical protein